jgi:nucleotidyltransferase/DNA polymerase involved in DNA repair
MNMLCLVLCALKYSSSCGCHYGLLWCERLSESNLQQPDMIFLVSSKGLKEIHTEECPLGSF